MYLVGILFPHINDDARSKSHQIDMKMIKCIKHNFKKIRKEAARLCGLNAEIQTITNIVHVNCKVNTRKMQANQKMARQFPRNSVGAETG